ncbi:MAG: aldo/keto reductase [Pseudomonadota bacterium]|nr:aldo/keto reductase [Pseudomonadota bacterium]
MGEQTGENENLVNGDKRKIGPFEVGPIGFGCWRCVNTDVGTATDRIAHALDLGLTLVDNADVYGLDWGGTAFGEAETLLGQVLARAPELRERMVLASKGGILPGVPYVANSTYLSSACDASLARLNTEHIDLYQIHRPDMLTHPAETAAALDGLVDAGKISAVGVSNYTPAQVRALAAHLKAPLVALQCEYSLANLAMLRDGNLDLCMETGLVPLAWSPLGGGALMTSTDLPPALYETCDRLAARENTDRAGLALAFVLAHPVRPVALIGSQTPARLTQAVNALEITLTRADVYALIEAREGVPLP